MTKRIQSTVDAKPTLGVKSELSISRFIKICDHWTRFQQLEPGYEDILVETYVNVLNEELHSTD